MDFFSHNDAYDDMLMPSNKEQLYLQELKNLRLKYKLGEIPKLSTEEMSILEFCHNRDMKAFLREEFARHPIILDESGGLIGGNPFASERRTLIGMQDRDDGGSEML